MPLNWRKPIILGLLNVTGSPILAELRFIRSIERWKPDAVQGVQNRRLTSILVHAWENTEYYREVLSECGVVHNGTVNLDRFSNIPFLTKDIIRKENRRLQARHLPKGRKSLANSSGGSTGQPVKFLQDSHYWNVNVATKTYHFEVLGKKIGEPEMKIWGSEKDLFEGTIGWKAKLQNFLYNRKLQQCFHLPEENIVSIIRNINTYQPKLIWCYRDGMDAVAKYVNRHRIRTYSPAAIVCLGGTLYPHIVRTIEQAFSAPVINAYGSREMGDIGFECLKREGIHLSTHSHKLEVIDENGQCTMDREGEIVVTSLMNYAMPFIRYRIGDRGKLATRQCSCGRGFPLLESVSGRLIERFINAKGEYIDPIYFIHLIGVVYNNDEIKRFQVIQDDYACITVKIILEPHVSHQQVKYTLDQITAKIRLVMGNECAVSYEFVDEIPLTKTGKFLYTTCKIGTNDVVHRDVDSQVKNSRQVSS